MVNRSRLSTPTLISIGLSFLTLTVLFAAQSIGLVPDPTQAMIQGRASLAEGIAIQISTAIGSGDTAGVHSLTQAFTARNKDLRSVAVVGKGGELLAATGSHQKDWDELPEGQSTPTQMQIPIFDTSGRCGTVQVAFIPVGGTGFLSSTWEKAKLAVFFGLGGFISFMLYMKRTLQYLDPSAVIPERVKAMLDTLGEGVLVIDNKERIVLANEAFIRVVGRPLSELQGRSPSEIPWKKNPDRGGQATVYPWIDAIREGLTSKGTALHLEVGSHGKRTFMVNAGPILGGDGKPRGALATFDDATEIEQMNAQLKEADRAKSEFLANMSHEIRTPLNGVTGMIELLTRTKLDDQQNRYVEIAGSSAAALLNQINDVLDMSKIEAGKIELERIEFDLLDLVESVAETFSQQAAKKRIDVVASLHRDVPRVVIGDPIRLRQILTNLTNNAIKFTDHGEVSIRAVLESKRTSAGTTIRFLIKDTGIGIPADKLDRLFSAFSQVDASTTRKYGGTGLGLTISKALTDLMGGTIEVTSQVGQGTTFSVEVSLDRGEHNLHPADVTGLCEQARGSRTLCVMRSGSLPAVLQEALRGWGVETEIITDTTLFGNALREASNQASPFNLVILDAGFDLANETEFAKAIGSVPDPEQPAVIVVHSLSDDLEATAHIGINVAAQLCKPVRQSDLIETINNVLSPGQRSTPDAVARADTSYEQTPINGVKTAKLLIAEDNDVNQIIAAEILSQEGYECEVVDNGKKAVEAVINYSYDLVLMDCQMPEMDGFEATRMIRKMESTSASDNAPRHRLPIIALTGNAMKGDRDLCIAAGMDDYLTKPFDPQLLVQTVRAHLPSTNHPDHPDGSAVTEASPPRHDPTGAPPTSPTGNDPPGSVFPAGPVRPDVPFDLESLTNRCMGNVHLIEKMLEKFRVRSVEDIQQIVESMSTGDADQLTQTAHAFKGVAANLSAHSLQDLAGQIESMGREQNLEHAQKLIDDMKIELDRCLAYIPTALQEITRINTSYPDSTP